MTEIPTSSDVFLFETASGCYEECGCCEVPQCNGFWVVSGVYLSLKAAGQLGLLRRDRVAEFWDGNIEDLKEIEPNVFMLPHSSYTNKYRIRKMRFGCQD